jgi:hypothetical protein
LAKDHNTLLPLSGGWVTAALWPDHLTLSPVRTLIIEKLTSVNWGIWNGFTHLGWNVWTGNQADLAATARRLAEVLERGPLPLVATGLLPGLAGDFSFAGSLTAYMVSLLGSLLLVAVLVWPVAITSWKGRVRRTNQA